jgi:PEGA domain
MKTFTMRIMTLTVGLTMLGAVSAGAAPRRAVVVVPRYEIHRPFVYDRFWGPGYPYAYAYPYGRPLAEIKTNVTPKDTEVYVDGYYAGRADDFDGVFQRLSVAPGGHAITFYLDGFRTVTEDVYVRPDSTLKMDETMQRLASGETSAAVPAPGPWAERRAPRT